VVREPAAGPDGSCSSDSPNVTSGPRAFQTRPTARGCPVGAWMPCGRLGLGAPEGRETLYVVMVRIPAIEGKAK
jgi:hypothetical protein